MSISAPGIQPIAGRPFAGFRDMLNSRWHKAALLSFMAIVIFHWFEHIVQAYQFFVLHWSRQMSMGFLGMYNPWLMKSEVLHYGFALVMLIALWVLRKGFTGTSYTWWMVSFWIQSWHHVEHFILFYQAQTGRFWFGGSVPTSVGQIWIPRIELHLIYNMLVFIPMVVAMYHHMHPSEQDAAQMTCTCSRPPAVSPTRGVSASGPLADPHARLRDRVFQRVIEGAGETEPAIRRAAADAGVVPSDLQALVDKIHQHAYKVTDEDVARLQAGHSDDYLFEIIVSAALGASRQRLFAALAALEEA